MKTFKKATIGSHRIPKTEGGGEKTWKKNGKKKAAKKELKTKNGKKKNGNKPQPQFFFHFIFTIVLRFNFSNETKK